MKNIINLFSVFEAKEQVVPSSQDQEKCFIYMVDQMVTIVINQSNKQTADHLTSVLEKLAEKYRFSFSNILVEAEKNNQPKRLDFLKKVWFGTIRSDL